MKEDDPELLEILEKGDPQARRAFLMTYMPLVQKLLDDEVKGGRLSAEEADTRARETAIAVLNGLTGRRKIPMATPLEFLREELMPWLGKQTREGFPLTLTSKGGRFSKGDPRFAQLVEKSPPFSFGRIAGKSELLAVQTREDLTPAYLGSQVLPYLQALVDLQQVFNTAAGRSEVPTVIRAITQFSPMTISLQGFSDAVIALREEIIPWRKEHAKKIAELLAKEADVEIKRKQAEATEIRAQTSKSRAESKKIEAEAAKLRAEADAQVLLNEKTRFELTSARLTPAMELAGKLRPSLSDAEKLAYAFQLMGSLETLTTAALEVTVVPASQLEEGGEPLALEP